MQIKNEMVVMLSRFSQTVIRPESRQVTVTILLQKHLSTLTFLRLVWESD